MYRHFLRKRSQYSGRLASFDLLARGCGLTDEIIASLARLFQRQLLLGGRTLSSFTAFSASLRSSVRAVNASRQGFDVHACQCQLMGKHFTSLALLLSGLRLLGGRSLGIFRRSVRSICGRFSSFNLLAGGRELTDEGIATLALLFQRQLLLGGGSLSSLQNFFSFSPRISQG